MNEESFVEIMLKKRTDTVSLATHIGENTRLEGTLITSEPIKIDGFVAGDIKSSSKVVIGPTGVVEGNLNVKQLYVAGHIKGDVFVEEKTQFVSGGHIKGNISSADFIMEMGASIDGMCRTNNKNNELNQLEEYSTPLPVRE